MKATDILILLGVFFLSYKGTQKVMGTQKVTSTVRGIRNNNWLNIKYNKANVWNGQTGQDDKGFAVFSDPVYSIRAGFKIFNSYKGRGLNTLRKVITTFAPPSENKTDNYVNYVASKAGVNPDDVLSNADYIKIMPWMIKMEIGSIPDSTLINKAWGMLS